MVNQTLTYTNVVTYGLYHIDIWFGQGLIVSMIIKSSYAAETWSVYFRTMHKLNSKILLVSPTHILYHNILAENQKFTVQEP